jgi:hypothetical protein
MLFAGGRRVSSSYAFCQRATQRLPVLGLACTFGLTFVLLPALKPLFAGDATGPAAWVGLAQAPICWLCFV